MLIETSQDLLNIVIAFCILWLTIFLAWFIYYLAMMFRQFYLIIKETKKRLDKVDEVIKNLKKRMEVGSSYLVLIEGVARKLIDVAKDKINSKKTASSSKNKKKNKKQ